MKALKFFSVLLLLVPTVAAGQTLDHFLHGGVVLDDKMDFGGGCATCCAWDPLFGWVCGECCPSHLCNQDHGEIKNLLHLTNPTASDADFQVDVFYFDGTQSLGYVSGTIASRGKVTVDLDGLFPSDTKAHVIVSSEQPIEGTVETLTQRYPLSGDPEVAFSAGVETPLIPFTSTRWRSGHFNYNLPANWKSVLYVVNPAEVPARGQIRLTRGGQVSGQSNVKWEECQTLGLGPKEALQLDLNALDPTQGTGVFEGFLEVDTGTAVDADPCLPTDPLGGSVAVVLLTRQGADLDGMPCPLGPVDFAEPIHGEIPYSQGLRRP